MATAVAGLLTASLAACGESSTDGSSAAAKSERLVLAVGGEPEDGFDPTLGWGRYGSPLFHSTLLTRGSDLSIENDLATGYEISDDGLTWTVELRDDAEFSNGEPVTAEDVAYTFTTAAKSGGLTDVTVLESAEAVDQHTVELTLKEPRSTFVNRLISLGIVPADAHGEGYAREPIGSGPFRLVSWSPGQQLIVERNDAYYGDLPDFAQIVFLFGDEDSALAAARAGEVAVAGVPASMATGQIEGMQVRAVTSLDNRGLAFSTVPDEGRKTDKGQPIGNDVTADVAIRRAVNLAVDREELVEGLLEGYGSPAFGPVDKAPWNQPTAAIEDDDVDAAVRVLEDAGWTDADGDGVREKDGQAAEFNLIYPAGDSLRQGLALSVVDMVAPAGIKVKAEGQSWEQIAQRMHADAVLMGWGSHDPTEMFNLYSSSTRGVEFFNTGFYGNPEVDEHLDAAMAATDEETATKHWQAAQLDADGTGFSASADAAWAWLVNLEHTYWVSDCLDLGDLQVEGHGHGWPITATIAQWRRTC